MPLKHSALLILTCLAIPLATGAGAAEPAAGDTFFESRVRPVLVERCYECHSGDSVESELHVDSLAGLLAGGTRGAALVPGDPKASLLILAVNHADQLHMPPKSKIPPREIADLTAWVKMGAPWPGSSSPAKTSASDRTSGAGAPAFADQTDFWAFQTPVKRIPPELGGTWEPESPIDCFILAKLEQMGLRPAPPADRQTLIRRATFDLTGLPPSVEEVERFVADEAPGAFERLVDRLLGSPRYGERWGRRWLDLARYADSNGLDENLAYANAFRYRDYVVAAWNRDKPYDRFLMEQLAGDLLSTDQADSSYFERITATGFLSLGAKMLAEDDPVKMQMDIVDEQIDTIGRALMGLTLACARCHDHKFDPIPTLDYYSLAGILKSTTTMENFQVVARWQELPLASAEALRARQQLTEQVAAKKNEIERLTAEAAQSTIDEARRHVGHYLLAVLEVDRFESLLKQVKPAEGDLAEGDPATAGSTHLRIIEAEHFDRGNVLKDRTNYGKDIGVLVNKGELPNYVEYDVQVERPGLYQFAVRYAAADARPCQLIVNGDVVPSHVAANVTGSWFADTQTWAVEGLVPLERGNNVFRLEQPRFFPHIDKIALLESSLNVTGTAGESGDDIDWSARYELVPELVRRWSDYLQKTANQPESVFALWHALQSGGEMPAENDVVRALRAEPEPASMAELAGRYQQRFSSAWEAWQKLTAGAGDERPAGLPDPVAEAFRQVLDDPAGPFAAPPGEETAAFLPRATAARLEQLKDERDTLEKSLPTFPETMAVSDGQIDDLRLHIRGSHLTLGEVAPRRFPRILAGESQQRISRETSGRLELAQWLTSHNHPLTARVIVNRIWQGHFGAGLVRSPDNFGRLGQPPTHPELLDYLAVRFVDQGWSIKALHRLIMNSAAYKMSSRWDADAAGVDPENRFRWRWDRRRLDAEEIRDSLLAMGGTLDLEMGGSLLRTPNRQYVTSTANVDPVVYETTRRSIYLPVVRSALYDVFQAFDFADPSYSSGTRETTTVAPQALFMINSKLVAQQTRAMAESLLRDEPNDDRRVRCAYQRAYGRLPSDDELRQATEYLTRYQAAAAVYDDDTPDSERRLKAWQSLCRAIVAANEFVYVE